MQNIIYCDHTEIKDEEVIIKNKGTIFYNSFKAEKLRLFHLYLYAILILSSSCLRRFNAD